MIRKKKGIFSIKHKLTIYFFIASLSILLIMKMSAPLLLHNEFIKDAKKSDYLYSTNLISQFIDENNEWGTQETALLFFNTLSSSEIGMSIRPPSSVDDLGPPPFGTQESKLHLVLSIGLVDLNGNTLIPFRNHEVGSFVPMNEKRRGDPLIINGQIQAYAFAKNSPSLTGENLFMLNRINKVINFGFYIALVVALIFGFTLGTVLTRGLRNLGLAAESLKSGLKGQQISNIKSRDEIGILVDVLNEMSLELERSHNQIKELAVTDELTKLYNRRFFNEELKILLPNARRYNHNFSIALGDVDLFKKVNDNFSHQIGDLVLIKIAEILKAGIREGDIVARFGGEEIIIALPEADSEAARSTIERLRNNIEKYNWESIAAGLKVTMSFGLCTERAPENYEGMVAIADSRLYEAKKSGRNRTIST